MKIDLTDLVREAIEAGFWFLRCSSFAFYLLSSVLVVEETGACRLDHGRVAGALC